MTKQSHDFIHRFFALVPWCSWICAINIILLFEMNILISLSTILIEYSWCKSQIVENYSTLLISQLRLWSTTLHKVENKEFFYHFFFLFQISKLSILVYDKYISGIIIRVTFYFNLHLCLCNQQWKTIKCISPISNMKYPRYNVIKKMCLRVSWKQRGNLSPSLLIIFLINYKFRKKD